MCVSVSYLFYGQLKLLKGACKNARLKKKMSRGAMLILFK